MEKGIIESFVASLPQSELGKVQQDDEIWEEVDGGAQFKVTRHILSRHMFPATGRQELLAVSISGEATERARVVQEFTEVYGAPISEDVNLAQANYVDVITWLR